MAISNLITFIIPSIGRSTLINSVQCLKNQTNPNWKAIIAFDGISPTIENDDPRITIMKTKKLGQGNNSAGLVRNKAIEYATSEWVAFLDDDDSISPDYVETFINEIGTYCPDVLIFRFMFSNNVCIVPHLDLTRAPGFGEVGISFAMKKRVFNDGCIFVSSSCEDYNLIHQIISRNFKVMISPYVKYFARYDNTVYDNSGTRIFINMEDITKI